MPQSLCSTTRRISYQYSLIAKIALTLPKVHFLGLDLSHFGRPDQTRVFLPTDEPHGQIEAVVSR
jgi:urate oxidase